MLKALKQLWGQIRYRDCPADEQLMTWDEYLASKESLGPKRGSTHGNQGNLIRSEQTRAGV